MGALTAGATTTLSGTAKVLPLTFGSLSTPPFLYVITNDSMGNPTSVEFLPIHSDASLGSTPAGGPLSKEIATVAIEQRSAPQRSLTRRA
jgi:hypothetical protein